MDNTAKGFAQKIVTELAGIKGLLVDAIRLPREQHQSPHGESQQANAGKQQANSRDDGAASKPSPAIASNAKPANEKRQRFPKLAEWKPVIETIGVAVVVVYTVVAALAWNETRRANNIAVAALQAARDNLIKDQRPYVMVTGVFQAQASSISEGEKTCWDITIANYGRSPAVRTVQHAVFVLGNPKGIMGIVDKYFGSLKTPLEGAMVFLPPGGPPALKTVPLDLTEWKDPSEGQRVSTVCSPGPLSKEQAGLVHTGGLRVVITGRDEYHDISGNQYSTDFCIGPIPTGMMMWCDTHNEIH